MPEAGAGRLSRKDTNLAGGAGDKTQPPVQAEDGQRQQGGELQTDRQMAAGVRCSLRRRAHIPALPWPAGRAWEHLPLLPCLSFPGCKVRSRLQTHAFIILSAAAGAGTLQTSHHLCFATGSLPGSARRGRARETHGQEEGDEMRPLQSASPQRAASVSTAQQRFFILHHRCLSAPVTKPSVQPLPTTAELGRGHAPPPPRPSFRDPLLQTV